MYFEKLRCSKSDIKKGKIELFEGQTQYEVSFSLYSHANARGCNEILQRCIYPKTSNNLKIQFFSQFVYSTVTILDSSRNHVTLKSMSKTIFFYMCNSE